MTTSEAVSSRFQTSAGSRHLCRGAESELRGTRRCGVWIALHTSVGRAFGDRRGEKRRWPGMPKKTTMIDPTTSVRQWRSFALSIFLFFVLLVGADALSRRSPCVMRFDIDKEDSYFRLSGREKKHHESTWRRPVKLGGVQTLHVEGALFMMFDVDCPSLTSSFLKEDIHGARFYSLPLAVRDDVRVISLTAEAAEHGGGDPLEQSNLSDTLALLTLESGPIRWGRDSQTSDSVVSNRDLPFVAEQEWSLQIRQLSESAMVDSTVSRLAFGALSTVINATGLLHLQDDKVLTLDMSDLVMRYPFGDGNIVLEGRLLATASLGCLSECNLRGRCQGSIDGQAVASCVCDCGWTGSRCDEQVEPMEESYSGIVSPLSYNRFIGGVQVKVTIPRFLPSWKRDFGGGLPIEVSVGGHICQHFATVYSNAIQCVLPVDAQLEAGNAAVVIRWGCKKEGGIRRSFFHSAAHDGFPNIGRSLLETFNSPPAIEPFQRCFGSDPAKCPGVGVRATVTEDCTCTCLQGWAGSKCDVCRSNQACQAENEGSNCTTDSYYVSSTKYKKYACTLVGESFAKTFVQDKLDLFCNKTSSTCKINLLSKTNSSIDCGSQNCTFTDHSSEFKCVDVHCLCNQGPCADVLNSFLKSASLSCNGDLCKLSVGSLDPFPAQCMIGECTSTPPSPLMMQSKGSKSEVRAIGVLVSVIVASSVIILSAYFWRRWQRKEGEARYLAWAKPTEETRLNGDGSGPLEGGPGQVLSIHNLAVKEVKTGMWAVSKRLVRKLWRQWKESKFDAEEVSTVSNDGIKSGSKKDSRTYILSGISFRISRGSVLAIMGPTGSGKTTLLNVLAGVGGGRAGGTEVYGEIEIDGRPRDDEYRHIAAMLPQEDFLFNTLTVEECIWYSAQLRLPAYMPEEIKEARVNKVIEDLGLTKVRKHRVGSSFSEPGLSGGERRRVRIAMELVCDPKIILLDEPTSGLDSHTSLLLVRKLNEIAQRGAIVILNVHQPSEEAFSEFDKVLLLSKIGKIVFYGPRQELGPFFSSIGYPCPPHRNFADHMLEIISEHDEFNDPLWSAPEQALLMRNMPGQNGGDHTAKMTTPRGGGGGNVISVSPRTHMHQPNGMPHHVDGLSDGAYFVRSPSPSSDQRLLGQTAPSGKAGGVNVGGELPGQGEGSKQQRYPQSMQETDDDHSWDNDKDVGEKTPRHSFLRGPEFERSIVTEIWVLYWRELVNTWRHPSLLSLHLAVALLMGLLVGCAFHNVQDTFPGIQNRAGAFYFSITLFAFSSLSALELFISDRVIFIQEGSSAYYGTFSYFFSKVSVDAVLLRVLPSLLYGIIIYKIMGLDEADGKFGVFLGTLMLVGMVTGALCSLLSLVVSSVSVANIVSIFITLGFMLFGGYLLNTSGSQSSDDSSSSRARNLSWPPKLSYFSYSWEILMMNELKGVTIMITAPGLVENVPVKSDVFLKMLGVSTEDSAKRADFGALVAMCFVYYCLGYLLLYYRVSAATRLRCILHRVDRKRGRGQRRYSTQSMESEEQQYDERSQVHLTPAV